jgi:hypothetical protein
MTEPEPKYEYQSYGPVISFKIDPSYQFKKKSWVPQWLWNLVSLRDPIKAFDEALSKARNNMEHNFVTELFKERQ